MLCNTCHNAPKCVKTCPKIERYLKSKGIYSSSFIRPEISSKKRKDGKGRWREVPFSSLSQVDIDKNPYFDHNI
jgi:hypothetical protein